jgi:hypothetical protein
MFNKESKKRNAMVLKVIAILTFISMVGFSLGAAILG